MCGNFKYDALNLCIRKSIHMFGRNKLPAPLTSGLECITIHIVYAYLMLSNRPTIELYERYESA